MNPGKTNANTNQNAMKEETNQAMFETNTATDTANEQSTRLPVDKDAEFLDYTQVQRTEFPPLPPFVGYLQSWDMSKIKFTPRTGDQAGQEVITTRFIQVVRPLTMAFSYYNGDHPESNGCVLLSWNLPKAGKDGKYSPNSVYSINMELENVAVEKALERAGETELLAKGRYTVQEGKDKGKTKFRVLPAHLNWMVATKTPFLWGGKDKDSYTSLGNYKPKEHQRVLLNVAPEGWESQIPHDLADQQAKAVAGAKNRWESRQAGRSGSGASETIGAPVADVDISQHEGAVLSFLDGRAKAQLIFEVAQSDLPESVKEGIYSDAIPSQLIAQGKLQLSDGVYSKT